MKKILVLLLIAASSFSYAYAKEQKYVKYRPYMGKLDNEIIETNKVSKNKISIERRKLMPVSNVKTYAFCYEYIITNSTGSDITIQNVKSSDFISLWGAAGRSNIPNKSDFVPVYGIAKGIQTDKEKNRFTHKLPENEIIKNGDTMRVLTLASKKLNPSADFIFTVNGKTVNITVK